MAVRRIAAVTESLHGPQYGVEQADHGDDGGDYQVPPIDRKRLRTSRRARRKNCTPAKCGGTSGGRVFVEARFGGFGGGDGHAAPSLETRGFAAGILC